MGGYCVLHFCVSNIFFLLNFEQMLSFLTRMKNLLPFRIEILFFFIFNSTLVGNFIEQYYGFMAHLLIILKLKSEFKIIPSRNKLCKKKTRIFMLVVLSM